MILKLSLKTLIILIFCFYFMHINFILIILTSASFINKLVLIFVTILQNLTSLSRYVECLLLIYFKTFLYL